MEIGYVGLGKMGHNMVERLLEKGHTVVAYDEREVAREVVRTKGAVTVNALHELVAHLATPRTVWLMVPHQAVDGVLTTILPLLTEGDTIIDGGNSPYKETLVRGPLLAERGIRFLDAGISGGPRGAREGACVMVGGDKDVFEHHQTLFADLASPEGFAHVGKIGAGHFTKMVHNGIEYGMMQAIAEGFDLIKTSDLGPDLTAIADLYNHNSVITSRLVGWLADGFRVYGTDLAGVTGRTNALGEGAWTVETAHELNVPVDVIETSVKKRGAFRENPTYQGQLLSVMRNQFGGHDVKDA